MNKDQQLNQNYLFKRMMVEKRQKIHKYFQQNGCIRKGQIWGIKRFIKQKYFQKKSQQNSDQHLNFNQLSQSNPEMQKQHFQKAQKNNCCQKNNVYKFQQGMLKENNKIVIGSYPYRGNTNICRLICEYVGITYSNQFFNPCSWKIYKQKNTQNWHFHELPFLIDGDLVVTQIFPMCQYVIKKSGHNELLGKTPQDALIVDQFFWGKDLIQSVLSLVVQHKNDPKKLMQQMHTTWMKTIRNELLQYQKNAKDGEFYLGYLTAIDFIFHEVFQHYKSIFRKQMTLFPKLLAIRQKVANLRIVKQFQKSDRFVSEICPLQFYRKWKLQKMKANNNSGNCQGNNQ